LFSLQGQKLGDGSVLVNCSRFFTKLGSLLQQIRSLQKKKIKEKEEDEPIADLRRRRRR
jgi:hypothetical protein